MSSSSASMRASLAASPASPASTAALRLVVMGVSGTGKSTVADGLAAAFGLVCLDGDDLHAPESVAKMRASIPLTDTDRWPWLDRIGARLAGAPAPGLVVSCSALRRVYRDRIRAAVPGVRFVFLDGDEALIRERMERRAGHYMPVALLRTQLQTLEQPGADETDVLRIDIRPATPDVVQAAIAAVRDDLREPAC